MEGCLAREPEHGMLCVHLFLGLVCYCLVARTLPAYIALTGGGHVCTRSGPLWGFLCPQAYLAGACQEGAGQPTSLTTKTIIFGGSYCKALYKNYGQRTKMMVFVVEGMPAWHRYPPFPYTLTIQAIWTQRQAASLVGEARDPHVRVLDPHGPFSQMSGRPGTEAKP